MKLCLKLFIGIWLGLWVSLASANATFDIYIVNHTDDAVTGQLDSSQTTDYLFDQYGGYYSVLNNQTSNVYSLFRIQMAVVLPSM